jgi:hypothetical protein
MGGSWNFNIVPGATAALEGLRKPRQRRAQAATTSTSGLNIGLCQARTVQVVTVCIAQGIAAKDVALPQQRGAHTRSSTYK